VLINVQLGDERIELPAGTTHGRLGTSSFSEGRNFCREWSSTNSQSSVYVEGKRENPHSIRLVRNMRLLSQQKTTRLLSFYTVPYS